MDKYKISAEEFDKVSYTKLANSPGASTAYGESRLKGEDLKKRLDKPLEMFREKLNALIDLIVGNELDDSIQKHIPTGINETHTLFDLIKDITSEGAEFASYLTVGELTLLEKLLQIDDALKECNNHKSDSGNPHKVTAAQVGLGLVDNTSDADKPISRATQEALVQLLNSVVKRVTKGGGTFAYVTDGGEDSVIQVARSADALSIPLRYTDGRVRVGMAVEPDDAVNKTYAEKNFIGKTGVQVLDGTLTISGDIFVGGEAKAKQLESLLIEDACVIANAEGVPLAELSGYVIRVTADSAYAIVYDPFEDCVKIGLGVYDAEAKQFTFLDGEAQALATRGDIAGGNIPKWDDEKKTFVDSEIAADKVAQFGAVVSDSEIPVISGGKVMGSGKKVSDFAPSALSESVAGALNGSAMGEAVVLRDVSKVEHSLAVRVSSENILPYPYVETTKTENGITFTDNGDGSITADGTAISRAQFLIYPSANPLSLKAGTYTISGCPQGGGSGIYGVWCSHGQDYGKGKTFTVTEDTKCFVNITVEAGITVNNLTFYPKIQIGSIVTPVTPYIADTSAVKVKAQGKNLIPYPYHYTTRTIKGITFTDNGDGSITANGTATDKAIFNIFHYSANKISNIRAPFALSGNLLNGYYNGYTIQLAYKNSSGKTIYLIDAEKGATCNATDFVEILAIYLIIEKDTVINNITFYPQVEIGETATEYEPYIEPIEYAQGEAIKSIYPTTTLTTDTPGALIEVEYNRDINKAFAELQQAIISLGGNV